MITVPTLLVGLGGIGSKVVDKVYGMLPPEGRRFVAIHAFDTNINDISKLLHLGRNRVTQTSTNWTVEQYLFNTGESVKEWFPYEYPEIRKKLLTEGAGQIRAVSRLAYRAAIESNKLRNIEDQVTKLFQENADGLTMSLRIMIVCSLAGGTGAGIFLQTAIFLRDLLSKHLDRNNILIRGGFILPDVLIKTKVLDTEEHNDVCANAYACLKELNAIMQTSRTGSKDNVTIELEYKPNQTDKASRRDHSIAANLVPYDFAFMFDFENVSGNNIGSFDNYLNQVVTTTYLQLFSPMSAGMFSVEDNRIQAVIRNAGKSRFCGAGVASLIYPYHEIVDFCAVSWAVDTLSEMWLKIDENYNEELWKYQKDLNNGIQREKPLIVERYPWLLENLATGDRPDPFFRNIYRSAFVNLENGMLGQAKHKLFLEAIEAETDRISQKEADLNECVPTFRYDEGKLNIREKAKNEIVSFEANLHGLRDKVFTFVNNNCIVIVNRVLFQDADEFKAMKGEDCRLNTWVLGQPEALHPVGVRYFLYNLFVQLDKRVKSLTTINQELERYIKNYETAYDLSETEDVLENAEDRIKLALSQSWIKARMKNDFKEFIGEYIEKSSKQLNRLVEYRKSKLSEKVLSEIQNHISGMLEEWEHYFRNLKEIRNSLKGEQILKGEKHDKTDDPTRIYIYASRQIKQKIWNDLSVELSDNSIPDEIAHEIYVGQYLRFCQSKEGKRVDRERRERPEKTEEMFRKDVIGWCRRELLKQNQLDMDIVRAVGEEARLNSVNDDVTFAVNERISSLTNLAKPFVPDIPGTSSMITWGLNSRAVAMLSVSQRNTLFGTNLLEDDGFSPYEILCYGSKYGLKAEDFTKFSCGDGEIKPAGTYYRAYQRKKDMMMREPDRYVTPHLDKRWHLPAYMPDLNMSQVKVDEGKINKAFLFGIIYGVLKEVDEDGKKIWLCLSGDGGVEAVKIHRKPVDAEAHCLYNALFFNPAVVDKVLTKVGAKKKQDIRDNPRPESIDSHTFIKGCREANILERIYMLPYAEPANDSLPSIVKDKLMPLLLDEISGYYASVYGPLKTNIAGKSAADFIQRLKDNVLALNEKSSDSYFIVWDTALAEKISALGG